MTFMDWHITELCIASRDGTLTIMEASAAICVLFDRERRAMQAAFALELFR